MPSGIIVNNRCTWRAPEWVVCNLFADVSLHLVSAYSREREVPFKEAFEKVSRLKSQLEPVFDRPTMALNISRLSGPDVRTVYRAIKDALDSAREKGAKAWYEPASFPEYVALIEELLEKMEGDARLKEFGIERR